MSYIRLEAEIDLADIETDDLVAEFNRRSAASAVPAMQRMFEALSLGHEQEALALLRQHLCDSLGRVIP
jgi:hypothetical protein